MTTVLSHLNGHQREEGGEADQKQHGDEWLREKEKLQAGRLGTKYARLLLTEGCGKMMFKPCVPPGTERIKVKVRKAF